MTKDEALEIVENSRGYIEINNGMYDNRDICLDGWFSLEELKACVLLMEAKEDF